jgi:hypothetical protein
MCLICASQHKTVDGPCFQIRDFIEGCVLRRLGLDVIPLSIVVQQKRMKKSAVDSSGHLEVMDIMKLSLHTPKAE